MANDEQNKPVEAPKGLIVKLSEVVREIDHVEKAGRNEFHKYNYVRAADVAWAVRKALTARNIYLVSDVVEVRNYEIAAREGSMQAVDVKMEFSFFDGDAPQTQPIVFHACGTGTDKGDKAIYKAMTGALKYGLRHAFLIPDESDPEADGETDKAVEAAKAVGEAKVAKLKEKMAQKPAEATKQAIPSLFYVHTPSGFYEILGDDGLKRSQWQILKPFWQANAQNILVNDEQLEGLKFHFEERKVPFSLLKEPKA